MTERKGLETFAPPRVEEAPASPTPFAASLDRVLAEVRAMLLAKNKAYGNSALEPARIFSRASVIEQILVRLDDKLSRVRNGDASEDVELDTLGYLVILRIARLQTDPAGATPADKAR